MKLNVLPVAAAALGLALAFASPKAFAEETTEAKPRQKGQLMERFDKNKDGQLSQDEVPAKVWERLGKADADGNGVVTKEEFMAAHKEGAANGEGRGGDRFAALDKDGDGKVSKEEAGEKFADRFDKVDANSDGFLTKDEIKAAIQNHGMRKDANGDGKISKEEFGGEEAKFTKLDKNSDGFLTADELHGARKHERGDKTETGEKPIRRGKRVPTE